MPKIAIIGDTHFGVKNDSPVFYEYFERYYAWLFKELESREITEVIQLGDLFDRRKYINFKTLSVAREIFLNPLAKNFNSYILAGNHDVAFKNTNAVNSVGLLLREYDSIATVECDPVTHTIHGIGVDFYPWICAENFQRCMDFSAASESKVAVGHFEFGDFEMYKGQMADHGMDTAPFARYDWVFSGHYHTHSHRGNIVYAGSPYELTWSDWADQKGIILLDTETMEWEFLKTPYTLFEKVFYDDKNTKRTTDLKKVDLQNKYVKLIVSNKTDFYQYDKYFDAVLKSGAIDVKVVEEAVSTAIDAVDGEDLHFDDTPTLMESFVDALEVDADKQRLKSILRALYVEANSITE